MAYERVQSYFDGLNMGEKVKVHATPCDTVPHAAANFGCEEARIAKTISLRNEEDALLIVTAGDTRIDNKKFRAEFGFKARMLAPDEVLHMTGHAIGGVCPFAVNEGVTVYLDESLKKFVTVFPACGSSNSAIELTMEELERYSLYKEWVDVCKLKE